MNEPAMISFFSLTGVILLVAGIATWRIHRQNRMRGKPDGIAVDENHGDAENGKQDRCMRGDDGDGPAENRESGGRCGRVLDGAGWAQIPNSAEDQEETRVRGRQGVVYEKADEAVVSAVIGGVEAETSSPSAIQRGSRPTEVVPFENLGGYRYGDFAYGHDNMAPLPVPALVNELNPYYHAPGIAEVEAVPACPYPSAPASNKSSMESGYGSPLTSYNGLVTIHQHLDDMMAALPIPKDHPLYEHHPVAHCPATPSLPRHDASRRPPVLQYERESLFPAPLNPRRGRHSPHVDLDHGQTSPPEPGRTVFTELRRRSSARSPLISSSGSHSKEGPEARYSCFESPLKQHPPELSNGLRHSREISRQNSEPVLGAIVGQIRAKDDVRNEWPLTTEMKVPIQHYSNQTPVQPASASEHHLTHTRHRHLSSCNNAWTSAPLTPESRQSCRPQRWSWTAEDFRAVGIKGDNAV
ncbi:uncharacterized protein Z519_06206 [Cladophialophora bantiana CBS 173.52]|uniref:Uncharacterized protein n=1 Tax=Cladophialophora bantiana (strain ATCC 10958 / CBS 173.52 / CDC B-1940 / NIH 8579) TaxID=1442370 RepID=A0A0D2EUS5_CLAB1|nr:uncharacterized protein Z519_06206 [Cladophialophora bantiana CBS 173.52]KIW93601.1 hypothetical protein Z519_06206 [Cladophialophora bantiana CBS 173.52]